MRLSIVRLAFVAATLLPLITQSHAQVYTPTEVTIPLADDSTITGTLEPNVLGKTVKVFKGIRYGEARTGDNRWTPSKLIKPTGNINATAFGNICYTDSRFDTAPLFPQSEDCLFLNVYAPAGATASSNLPVMVWTHGGSWVSGSGNIYDGRNLVGAAGNDVIYVSFNYRLGLFGFLANQNLLKEGNGANFALRDMELAHQWVRENIAQFGGNPKSITAFGESAGAMMIALQMVTKGGQQTIFDKAILESGSYPSFSQVMTVAEQDTYIATVASKVGCTSTDATKVLSCLRATNATALVAAGGNMDWRPIVDNKFLVDLPYKLVAQNKFSKIPTVLGTNTDEGYLFTSVDSEAAFQASVATGFPQLTAAERVQLPTLYPAAAFADQRLRAGEMVGDVIFVCPSETLAQLAVFSKPSYHYRFNEPVAPFFPGMPSLAIHTAEMRFVFFDSSVPADAESQALARNVGKFWTNFARYGSPNGATSDAVCVWPRYDAGQKKQIVLQKTLTTEVNGAYMPQHAERCAFWNEVEARIANGAKGVYTKA